MTTKLIDHAQLLLTYDAVIQILTDALTGDSYGVFSKMTVIDVARADGGDYFLAVTLAEVEITQDETDAA